MSTSYCICTFSNAPDETFCLEYAALAVTLTEAYEEFNNYFCDRFGYHS